MPARMATSLLIIGLLLTATHAVAQESPQPTSTPYAAPTPAPSQPIKVLHYTKPANAPLAPATAPAQQIRTCDYPLPPTPVPSVPPPPPVSVVMPDRKAVPSAGSSTTTAGFVPPAPPPAFSRPTRASNPTPSYSGRPLQQVAFQPRDLGGTAPGEEATGYQIQLEPPGPQRLFQLDSEAALHERMRQEGRQRPSQDRIEFPTEPTVGGRGPYAARQFPPANIQVEPSYLCYDRLYFEEKNSERYGWDLGVIQPFVSAGAFYWDLATLPYHIWTRPLQCYECNTGYCLPGDPVPYLLYPPELSLTGTLAEAATVAGLVAIFP